jgi:hypothetical protein
MRYLTRLGAGVHILRDPDITVTAHPRIAGDIRCFDNDIAIDA